MAIIDKIVLGILAAVVIGAFQQCSQQSQKERDQRAALASIETTIVKDAISVVNETMEKYLALADQVVERNAAATAQERPELTGAISRLRRAFVLIWTLSPTRQSDADELTNTLISSMGKLNLLLFANPGGQSANDRKTQIDQILLEYRQVLQVLRGALIDAATAERATAL